jgi:hypothetical protein
VRDEPRPPSSLFTYGTDISLRGPERRHPRLPLVLMLLATAVVAGLVLFASMWLATADFAAVFASARDLVMAAFRRP